MKETMQGWSAMHMAADDSISAFHWKGMRPSTFRAKSPSNAVTMLKATKRHLWFAFLIGGCVLHPQVGAASLFGSGDAVASVKVTNGGEIKGKSTVAIGAFRVAFVTEDAANGVARSLLGSSAAKISATLVGVDQPLMQKITDAIYAEFLKRAAAKGYTIVDSTALANAASAYAALPPSQNFSTGRLGTFVIPSGQRSVALASDDRAKQEKGSAGFAARFAIVSDQVAKTPAYDAFPTASRQVDAPVLGVTVVANFADFKGSGSLGGSKATLAVGATIDGRNKNEIVPSTSILGWNGGTGTCPFCQAQFTLEGQIHSEVPIGTYDGAGERNNQSGTVTVDPASYEKNILLVAGQAIDLLLDAMAAEK